MTLRSGLLLVDKDRGPTSHDVVDAVRRALGEKRVGHAGTLDPMATGLLVLGVGPATRLLRFAQAGVKRYTGTLRLGVATDSLDADGAVVAEAPVPEVSPDRLTWAAAAFHGTIHQVPPMVSAVQVGGERLHVLARRGVEVERAAREVTIRTLRVTPGVEAASLCFDVTCSSGTYVRVLMSDFAEALGTLGHLTSLRRVGSGRFGVADALTLDQVVARVESGEEVLRPAGDFVGDLAAVTVDEDAARRVRQGQRVALGEATGEELAAFDERGELVAVLRRRDGFGHPEVVLGSGRPEARR